MVAAAAIGLPLLGQAAPQLWEVLRARAAVLLERGSNPDDARPFIYREALRQIADRPITGQGPGNYVAASHTAESSDIAGNALHAHNVLLTISAEAGLLAVVLLIGFTLSVARRVLRARHSLPPRDRELMLGLACSLVAVVGQGLVDFTFRNPVLLMLTWFMVGLVFAATTPGRREEPSPSVSVRTSPESPPDMDVAPDGGLHRSSPPADEEMAGAPRGRTAEVGAP
jgi:putative inorganic carbon (HCO3(-)) transporter